ncbi:hypothetical protein [Nocardia sp. NRRL S-836]|uniref:hypothetical protein n=1 Tax=Nocardia sp. NRRL S-836 TaxID=1519492 RepID=UPI0006ADD096|nr:hypothetical protein [Nocardia sp. NRRL S-836]KOV84755.1 hypothetical protein ADL03_15945 [Nocardia sp. NRRL S-836]
MPEFDAQALVNERNAHILAAVNAHAMVVLLENLSADHADYGRRHLSDRLADCGQLALMIKLRDDALAALLGTRLRVAHVVEQFGSIVLNDDAMHSDGAKAAWRTVLTDKLTVSDVEDARLDGYRLGTAFAAFEHVYPARVPVPAVPLLYRDNAAEFEHEFARARREYKPDETTCHC